jgi:peptide chain release factor 1
MLDERVEERLEERLARYRDLESRLADPEVIAGDPHYPDYMREHGTLHKTMQAYLEYRETLAELEDHRQMAADESEEAAVRELAREEIPALEERAEAMAHELVEEMLGNRAEENKNVIVEIRAGTGGDEAALFAGDLYRMYMAFADNRGWTVEDISASPGERGGFKEIVFGVQGRGVYRDLRHEGGGHRVQRVPETETQGRIHTSAATVAVLPEAEEYEVELRPDELRIEVCRSQGPGGQSVNTTDSAVRVVHEPTGIMVFMQEEKSQHKNKAKALRILRSRVFEAKKREQEEARAAERRGQTGSGDRSERIRTYNFPQDRCTDHRLKKNFPLGDIIQGKLDKLVEELVEYGRQQDLAESA